MTGMELRRWCHGSETSQKATDTNSGDDELIQNRQILWTCLTPAKTISRRKAKGSGQIFRTGVVGRGQVNLG